MIKNYKKIFFAPILLITIYLTNKYEFSKGGIGNSVLNNLKLEYLLVLFFSYTILFYFKEKITSYIVVFITIISFYIFFNEYYILFNRPLKLSDYHEIPELISVCSSSQIWISTVVLIVYFFIIIYHINFKKLIKKFYVLIPLILFLSSVYFTPKLYLSFYKQLNFTFDNLNMKKGARESGFLNFMFYEEALKNKVLKDLKDVRFVDEKDIRIDFMKRKNIRPNIHLIVLESFFDPNMFSHLSYNLNPIHPSFQKYYKAKNLSISPAYGGGTPLAEYEILTGTPALRKYASIEFNIFTGNTVKNALPNKLREIGYRTIATNALGAETFNAFNAYKGLGFSEQHYLKDNKTYLLKDENDRVIFDGDLLQQNLNFIREKYQKEPEIPIFNYVLGMYGHTPHSINTKKRPIIIESFNHLTNSKDQLFNQSVNQSYYRTKHITKYIDEISKLDANAVVLVIGDHLPRINEFTKKGYINNNKHIIHYYFINKNKSIKVSKTISHYNISDLILNSITNLNEISNQNLDSKYDQIIKQATQ